MDFSFKKVFLCLMAAVLLLNFGGLSQGSTQGGVLRIRVAEYPPQYYRDASGNWTGIDVELGRALAEAAGLSVEFLELPWSRALESMKKGTLDLMMNLSRTPEREKFMHFIGPERVVSMVLVVKEGSESLPVVTMDDLLKVSEQEDRQFGIQQDLFYSQEFNERLRDPAFAKHFDAVVDPALNPRKVLGDRILGFFEDKTAMAYEIAKNPAYEGLAIHPFVLEEEEVYFGISKKITLEKLAALEDAYQKLEADGTFESIRQRSWR